MASPSMLSSRLSRISERPVVDSMRWGKGLNNQRVLHIFPSTGTHNNDVHSNAQARAEGGAEGA